MAQRNEIEAMNVIINIQTMQQKVYGKQFEYKQFKGNTIEELRKLQDDMIIEYNKTFKMIITKPLKTTKMKKIIAKFNSKCAETNKPIKKGESMYYDYSSKKCYCLESNKVKDMDAEQDDNAQEAAYFDNFCQQNNI